MTAGDNNVIPMQRASHEQAALTAWRTWQTADANWIEATINLALRLKELRDDFENDQEFGQRLDELGLKEINKDDRSAFISMAKHIEITREALPYTSRRSVRYIWLEDIAPKVHERKEIPQQTQGVNEVSLRSETAEMPWSQRVAWMKELRATHRDRTLKWAYTEAGFSSASMASRAEEIVNHGIPELITAVDDELVTLTYGAERIVSDIPKGPYNSPARQQQLLTEKLSGTTQRTKPTPEPEAPKGKAGKSNKGKATAKNNTRKTSTARERQQPAQSDARVITRFVEATPGFADKTYLTDEQAGLPADATWAEKGLFHQLHGMHPTETINGRQLSEAYLAFLSFIGDLSRVETEIATFPTNEQVLAWIDRMLAHTPRPDIGHGEQRDYAASAQNELERMHRKLEAIIKRVESYQQIIRDRLVVVEVE